MGKNDRFVVKRGDKWRSSDRTPSGQARSPILSDKGKRGPRRSSRTAAGARSEFRIGRVGFAIQIRFLSDATPTRQKTRSTSTGVARRADAAPATGR